MVAPRSVTPLRPRSLARRLAWPGTISLALAAIAACGGSSEGNGFSDNPTAGSGGSLGISGSTGTTAGRSSSSSGSSNGGKQAVGGQHASGGDATTGPETTGPESGGEDAGGAPGKPRGPNEPPQPPHGMAGAGGADADCPAEPPTDKAECDTMLKCDYPERVCNCDGPPAKRSWKCKEPPKPMTLCPPMPPMDASACMSKDEGPPAPPCHYEAAAVDCQCTDDEWACVEAP